MAIPRQVFRKKQHAVGVFFHQLSSLPGVLHCIVADPEIIGTSYRTTMLCVWSAIGVNL